MNINDIINARILTPGYECEVIDKVEVIQTVLQETEPYSITKSITGTKHICVEQEVYRQSNDII